jgi:hypothetical protein
MNVPKLANTSHTPKMLGKLSRNTLAAWGRMENVKNMKGVGVYL